MSLLHEIQRRYAEALSRRDQAGTERDRPAVAYQQGKMDLLREAWTALCGSDTLHEEVASMSPSG